jgi:hypothetical protein
LLHRANYYQNPSPLPGAPYLLVQEFDMLPISLKGAFFFI